MQDHCDHRKLLRRMFPNQTNVVGSILKTFESLDLISHVVTNCEDSVGSTEEH